MATKRQWVMWRYLLRGAWTKPPYRALVYPNKPDVTTWASATKPSTWRSLDEAMAAYDASQSWDDPFDGIGFVFSGEIGDDGLCDSGVDLDAWGEGEQKLYAKLATTYAEWSPSGRGVHIITRAKPFEGTQCKAPELSAEAYCTGRYFTYTGQPVEGAPTTVEALPDEVTEVVAEINRVKALARGGRQPRSAKLRGLPGGITESAALDGVPFESLTEPEPLNLEKLKSAVWKLPDALIAPNTGGWVTILCRALANEAMRAGGGGGDPEIIEQLYELLDARSREVDGYDAETNRIHFERCMRDYGKRTPILSGTIYWYAAEQGWSWTPGGTPESNAPLVKGDLLKPTLPQQFITDVPGNSVEVMTLLDRRVADDPYTFRNRERLICVRVWNATSRGKITDESNMPALRDITVADVRFMADRDYWRGFSSGRVAEGEKPKLTRKRPSREVCEDYLEMSGFKDGVRSLNGLARVPIIDDEGNLDFGVGYHAETGVFRDHTPLLEVPDAPTQEDCTAAYNTLMYPFQEYQFSDPALGEAQVLTFIITAIERPFIRTAPMFFINSPMPGTGKGLLLRAVSHLAFGTGPLLMNYGHDEDEFDKRIISMFTTGKPFQVIDNANDKHITNHTLETAISEGEVYVRVLGRTGKIHIVVRALLAATGTHIGLAGDMPRRALVIDIMPKSAAPEADTYPFQPDLYVIEHHDEMLTAAFTIMRAFRQEGMPKQAKTSAGSFPEWERRVRDLVMWATGNFDMVQQFTSNRDRAVDKQNNAGVVRALFGVFGSNRFRSKDATDIYDKLALRKRLQGSIMAVGSGNQNAQTDPSHVALFEAFEEQFGSKPVNPKSFGWWTRRVNKTYIDGMRLVRDEDTHDRAEIYIEAGGGAAKSLPE